MLLDKSQEQEKKARQAEQEEKIRPLAVAGLSQREIERATGIPQSTVSRIYQRINSGPQPIIRPEQQTAQLPVAAIPPWRPGRAVLITIALVILAAAIGSLTWLRTPGGVIICVRYSATRNITGLSSTRDGHCGAGWQPLTLGPGG